MQQEQHGPCAEIIVYSHSQLKNDAQLTPIVGCYRDAAARMNHRQIQPLCKICYTVCFILEVGWWRRRAVPENKMDLPHGWRRQIFRALDFDRQRIGVYRREKNGVQYCTVLLTIITIEYVHYDR